MTLGEKIKALRQRLDLSQSQLAQQLHVSRAAIAKWENDNGTPDVDNLKALAEFFHTNMDSLCDEKIDILSSEQVESVHFEDYEITGHCRNKYDSAIVAKFPNACRISPASLIFDFNPAERIVNTFTFGFLKCIWRVTHWKAYTGIYYFVETEDQQYLVQFEESKMITVALSYRTNNIMHEFFVGNRKFMDLRYDLLKGKDCE